MTRAFDFVLTVSNKIKHFIAHSGAAAATEFALIVPVLAGLVIALDDYANISMGSAAMQTGSRAALEYAMRGGTDMAAAKTLGMQAWNSKPADAAMTVVQACLCANVVSACNQPCPDNSFPTSFVTVSASGTYGGNVYHAKKQLTEKVRLR